MAKPTAHHLITSTSAPSKAATNTAASTSKRKPASNIVRQSPAVTKQDVATTTTTSVAQTNDKRKRIAANARERKRMHLLNKAYDKLRKRLADAENKSKYDVLVQAKEYIQALTRICENFDRQHPNQCPKMEPVQDTWPTCSDNELTRPDELYQLSSSTELRVAAREPSLPLSPSVPVKLDFSPQSNSVLSSSIESCVSPMSQPDSVISTCSQPATQVIFPASTPISQQQHCYLNHTAAHKPENVSEGLNLCSTLLSPPPSSTLSPPVITSYDYTSAFDSLLMPGRHTYQAGTQPTNTDIYHQYYQTFYHIQRAT